MVIDPLVVFIDFHHQFLIIARGHNFAVFHLVIPGGHIIRPVIKHNDINAGPVRKTPFGQPQEAEAFIQKFVNTIDLPEDIPLVADHFYGIQSDILLNFKHDRPEILPVLEVFPPVFSDKGHHYPQEDDKGFNQVFADFAEDADHRSWLAL